MPQLPNDLMTYSVLEISCQAAVLLRFCRHEFVLFHFVVDSSTTRMLSDGSFGSFLKSCCTFVVFVFEIERSDTEIDEDQKSLR